MAAHVASRAGLTVCAAVQHRAGRAAPASRVCVRARAGASALPAPALAGRAFLRGAAISPSLRATKPSSRAAAVSPVALFKQDKDSVQWLNVICTLAACAAFIVPLVRRGGRRALFGPHRPGRRAAGATLPAAASRPHAAASLQHGVRDATRAHRAPSRGLLI
jgi:hypothetical protein